MHYSIPCKGVIFEADKLEFVLASGVNVKKDVSKHEMSHDTPSLLHVNMPDGAIRCTQVHIVGTFRECSKNLLIYRSIRQLPWPFHGPLHNGVVIYCCHEAYTCAGQVQL